MSQAATEAELDDFVRSGMTAAGLSDEATYTHGTDDPVACVVFITRGVSLQGELSHVVNEAVTIEAHVRQIGDPLFVAGEHITVTPAGGDTFTIGSETFVVDSILSKDGSRAICVVSPE